MPQSAQFLISIFLLTGALLPSSVVAATCFSAESLLLEPAVSMVLLLLLVTVTGLLYHNHLRYKKASKALRQSQLELEQKVVERTDKLRSLNAKLYDEIDRHKATEELLRQTQDSLHSIINSMPSVIIGINSQQMITHWNNSAEQKTGIAVVQALGKQLHDIYHQGTDVAQLAEQAIVTDTIQIKENIQEGEGSHARYTDISAYPLMTGNGSSGAVIRIDDVTMRVQLENMMIQNEKMISLGELAAGMAHEINNPLSAVIQSTQNIQRRLSDQLPANLEQAETLGIPLDKIYGYLEQRDILHFIQTIREASERAANIVANMLEFARYNNRNHAPVNLTQLIRHSLELAAGSFQLDAINFEDIEIDAALPDNGFPSVVCSGAEIQQVLLNILRNAAQAVTSAAQQHGRPQIIIRLSHDDNDAIIEVSDNGCGMPDSIKRHIFDPFFTTKDVGKGTRLGLSISYFIITERHSGTIEVESSPGEGARFIIRLPLHADQKRL